MRDKLNLTKMTKKDLKETKGGLIPPGVCLCQLFNDGTCDNVYWAVVR